MGRYSLRLGLIASLIVALTIGIVYGRVGTARAYHAAAGTPIVPSWPGGSAQYLGRYRLVKSGDQALAQSGQLTLFLRLHVPQQPKPVLSGILNLNGSDGTNVFYLTHFEHQGPKRWTRINLGTYTGPMLGTFVVTSFAGEKLTAEFEQQGRAPIALSFVRFSHNPLP